MTKLPTFEGLNVSSKFAICGLPIRLDTYKTCSFNCQYCFSNNRKIMEFKKDLQVANVKSISDRLHRIFNEGIVKEDNLLDKFIQHRITWHCGGMSDPFQPINNDLKITKITTKKAHVFQPWDELVDFHFWFSMYAFIVFSFIHPTLSA